MVGVGFLQVLRRAGWSFRLRLIREKPRMNGAPRTYDLSHAFACRRSLSGIDEFHLDSVSWIFFDAFL